MSVTLLRPSCTRDDVQQITRNEDSDNNDAFDAAINLASRWIEERTHRVFWFHDHTSTPLIVRRGDVIKGEIFLPFPIVTLTQLATYESDDSDEDVWAADEYWWENQSIGGTISSAGGAGQYRKHIAEGGSFIPYPNKLGMKVKLTGTFGWGSDAATPTSPRSNIPAAVSRAAAMIAASFSELNHKQEISLDGGVTELLETSIPSEARNLLKPYKLRHRNSF
jgi:hypothetical protein